MENKNKQSGFTVAEILISVSVFIILSIVAVGAFINGLRSQRNLTDIMAMNNNLGIVLEQMAREFRTGYFDGEPGNMDARASAPYPGSCNSSLSFVNGQETRSRGALSVTEYSLSGGRAYRSSGEASGYLTSQNVEVESLCFYLQWTEGVRPYCNPPRLTIRMRVRSATDNDYPPRYIQTTVSSRVLPRDIESDPFECKIPDEAQE